MTSLFHELWVFNQRNKYFLTQSFMSIQGLKNISYLTTLWIKYFCILEKVNSSLWCQALLSFLTFFLYWMLRFQSSVNYSSRTREYTARNSLENYFQNLCTAEQTQTQIHVRFSTRNECSSLLFLENILSL